MPDELGVELNVDYEQSLAGATALGSTIDDSLSSAADSFSSVMADAISNVPAIAIEADTSSVESAITDSLGNADSTLAIDADASAIPADVQAALDEVDAPVIAVAADTDEADKALQNLAADADALQPVVTVDADTAEAEDKLASLSGVADEAAGAMAAGTKEAAGFTGAQELLGGASEVAAGHLVGVGAAAKGLGLGEAAIAVAAVGTAFGAFVEGGIDATSAAQRFKFIVGDMRDEVKTVNVGSLNEDLGHLAIKLGTDDEALTNSAATLFQFGKSAEASGQQSATFTDEVVAMAARAVALNPALGDVAGVADKMLKVFATGRDKALIPYSIALDKTTISQRALEIAQADGRTEASRFDTAQATAQLSVEKYGNTLDTTVAKGAENASIQQKSLHEQINNIIEAAGKPLVGGFLEAFDEGLPSVEAFASTLGRLAADALPLVIDGLKVAGPTLGVVADIIEAIPTPLLDAAAGLFVFSKAMDSLKLAGGLASLAGNLPGLFQGVTASAGTAGAALGVFTLGFSGATAIINATGFDQDIRDVTRSLFGLGDGFEDVPKKVDAYKKAVGDTASLTGDRLVVAFEKAKAAQHSLSEEAGTGASRFVTNLRAFTDLANANKDAAAEILSHTQKGTAAYDAYASVLKGVIEQQNADAASKDEQAGAAERLTGVIDATAAGFIAASDAFGVWGAAALHNLGVTDDELSSLAGDVDQFASSLEGSIESFTNPFTHNFAEKVPAAVVVSKQAMLDFLKTSNETAQTFLTVTDDLIGRGVDEGIIQNIARAGPEALPQMQALVQVVDEQGADTVNAMFGHTSAMAQQTEEQFRAMVLSTTTHMVEQNLIVKAQTADMEQGGTSHLAALAANSDANLAQMARDALTHLADIRSGVDSLPTEHPIVIDVSYEIQPLADAFNAAGIPVTQDNLNAFALSLAPHAAEGMIVQPRPGGTLVNIGEAGSAEVILPTDDPARAWDLLLQSGLAAQLGAEYQKLFLYLGGVAAQQQDQLFQYLGGVAAANAPGSGVVAEDSPGWQWWSMGNMTAGMDVALANPPPQGIETAGPGDTSLVHAFEDGSAISELAYYLKWGFAWPSFAEGGRTDWPEDEARLAMLHGQESIFNKEQTDNLAAILGDLPRYAGRPWHAQTVAPAPAQNIDNSVHTQVDARGQEDATMIGIAVARRQRAELSDRSGS